MTQQELDKLFNKVRTEEVETSVKDVQKWIGYSTIVTVIIALLFKLKVSILKHFVMYTAILSTIGISAYFIATSGVQKETVSIETPKINKEISILPVETKVVEEENITPIKAVVFSDKVTIDSPTEVIEPIVEDLPLAPPFVEVQSPRPIISLLLTDKQKQSGEITELGNIKKIQVSGALIIEIIQGTKNEMRMDKKEGEKDFVKMESANGILTLSSLNNKSKTNTPIIYLTLSSIESITCSGASAIKVKSDFVGDDLDVLISGASVINFSNLTLKSLTTKLSGASSLTLKGSTTNMDVISSGASVLEASQFESEICKVKISGASSARVFGTKKMNLQATGASNINYKGNPESIEKSTTGESTISKQ